MMVVKFDSETMAFLHSMSKKGIFDVLIKSSSLRQSFQTICHIHIRKKSSQKNHVTEINTKFMEAAEIHRAYCTLQCTASVWSFTPSGG